MGAEAEADQVGVVVDRNPHILIDCPDESRNLKLGLSFIDRRESKQPNGCFSLRWTQYITASERVDMTPPPLSSHLNSVELSFS